MQSAKSGMLINSNTLKALLSDGSKENKKRKPQSAVDTDDLIKSIVKQETGKIARKRLKLSTKGKKGKKRGFGTIVSDITSPQRARLLRLQINNVHEYARIVDYSRDDAQYLDRKYPQIRGAIDFISGKMRMGFEQMNGPGASKVTYGEAFLLLNFSEVEMDINMFDNLFLSRLYGKKLTKAEVDGVFEEGDPQGEVEFDRLHNSVLAYQRMRYFALTLAEMRGLMTRSASSTLRQASGGNATGYSTTGLALTSSDRLSSSRYSNTHSILRSQSQPAVLTESQATLLRSLPPIRLRKMQEASVKKKTMKKAGYDSSFSRPTPRVLQASGAGSIGGRKKADIEGLRRELYIAKEGMKQLDKLVDNNIAWVQSNCDVQTAAPHFSLRTIKKCRTMAIERIHNVFNNYVQVTLAWGWQRWLTACQYSLFMDRSHDFSKLKSIELITVTMYDALSRQYAKGFNQWIHLVHKEKMLEAEAASVEIQRIVRGYNGKNRFKRVKYDLAATLIQCLLRKKKAYKVMDEKKKELAGRNIHQAARIIQQFIKDRICIIRAKKEAERRRQLQAAISIQKIHRGAAARSKKDLEQITSDKHDSSKTIDSGISVTPSGKRSLFKPSTWRQSTPTSSSRPSSQQGNKKLPKNVLDEGNEADAETAEVKPSEAVSHRSEESTVSRIQKVSRGKTARTQSRKKNAIFGSMFSGRDCSVDSNSDCNRVRDDISDSSDGEKSVNSGTSSRIEKYFRVLYKAFKPAEVDKKALDIQRVVRGALARKLSQKLKKEKSLKMSNSSRDDEIPSSPMEVDEIISSRISTSKELPDIPKQILKEGSSDEEKRPKSSNFGIDTPGVASVTRPYASPDIFHNPSKSASSEGFDRGEDSYRSAQSIGNENVQAVEDSCIIPTTVKEDLTENQDTSAESTHVASLPVESDSLLQILPDNPGPVEKPVNNVQQEGITNLVDQDNLNTPDPTSDNHDFAEAADSVDAVHTKALEDDLVTNLSLAPVDVTAPKKKNGKKEEEARARREKALARVKEAEEKRKAAEAIARHTREEREAKEKQLHEKKKKSIQKMPDTKSSNDNHSSTPARDARGSHEKISNVSTSKSATHPQLPPVPDEDTKIRERSTVVSLLTELDVENMKESDSLIEATPRRMLSSRSSRSSRSSSRDRRVSFDTTSDEVHGKMEPEILPEIRKSRDTTPRTRNRGVTPQSSRHVTPRASKHTTPRSSKHNTPRISKPNTANHSRSNTPKAGQINFFSDEDGIRSDSCDIDERLKSLEEASSEDLLSHKLYVIHEEKACKKIQNRIRIFLAIRRLNEKKSERKDLEVKSRSSIQIQRITRGRIGRKKVQAKILDVQAQIQKKREIGATKMQSLMRGRRDRKKAAVIKKEVEHNRWLASFLKDGKPSTPATKSPANKSTKSIKESNNVLPTTTVAEDSTFSIKTSGKESSEAFSANLLEEKIRKLEMIEKSIRDREQAIIERSRESEERAKAMEKALQLLEQRAKEDEAERLARQELMMMAAGPISHRSQYASIGPKSSRSVINTSRSRSGKHQSQPQTARMPDAPPTARSARGGASIPPDALRRSQDGHEWVRLWDPDEAWYYWYNEITQEAQWEEAGQEEGGDGYYSDSGYESTGAMTDYSTDQYESGGEFGESELEDDWQEYWDEQAQAKYWYNNATGEASWTKPVVGGGSSINTSRSALTSARTSLDFAGDWVSYIDEETSQEYWYNTKTGETSWA